jgi:hypothetical protein
MNAKVKIVGLGILNSVSTMGLEAATSQPTEGPDAIEEVQTSLSSIYEDWIKVPPTCKAKNFNAIPGAVEKSMPSLATVALYQSLGSRV